MSKRPIPYAVKTTIELVAGSKASLKFAMSQYEDLEFSPSTKDDARNYVVIGTDSKMVLGYPL